MAKSLLLPIKAIKSIATGARAVLRQNQRRSLGSSVTTTLPGAITTPLPEATDTAAQPAGTLGCTDADLVRYAWNGSIPEGALRTRHQQRLRALAAERAANATLQSGITNRLAALEAELSVLVEQPPHAPPEPKVLSIRPF